MSDGPIILVGPDGRQLILTCALAERGAYIHTATIRVWRELGGARAGVTIMAEADHSRGVAFSVPAAAVPVLCDMLKKAVSK